MSHDLRPMEAKHLQIRCVEPPALNVNVISARVVCLFMWTSHDHYHSLRTVGGNAFYDAVTVHR